MKVGDLVKHRASGNRSVVIGIGEREQSIIGRVGYSSTKIVPTGRVTVSTDYGHTVDVRAIELEVMEQAKEKDNK